MSQDLTATDGPCLLRTAPAHLAPVAYSLALRERPSNAVTEPEMLRLGVLFRKQWDKGRRIGVALHQPSLEQRRLIFDVLESSWQRYCSLTFFETTWDKADLRFTLDPGGGNWSMLGTDAQMLLGRPTGNLGQLTRGIIAHEFGHGLGFAHNMALPNYPLHPDWNYLIPWARQTQGWDEATVRAQFAQEPAEALHFSETNDLKSVMQYWQEAAWNLERITVPVNDDLSDEDKRFVGLPECYGPPIVDPVPPPQPTEPTPVAPPLDEAALILRQVVVRPYRAGGVSILRFVAPRAGDYTLKIQDLEVEGSPVVAIVPDGGPLLNLNPTPGASPNVVLFPVTLRGPGRHTFQVQFRGTAPRKFKAQIVRG